jgi:hypothetical protein
MEPVEVREQNTPQRKFVMDLRTLIVDMELGLTAGAVASGKQLTRHPELLVTGCVYAHFYSES